MNNIKVLALLTLVLLASGCLLSDTDGTIGTGYPGVVFTDFYPVAPEVYEGGTVSLYLAIQNNGYFDAENVNVTLYNCGDVEGVRLESTGGDYKCNDYFQISDKLDKPDRGMNIAGEVAEEEITLQAPSILPEGRSPHTFTARVQYDYLSTATRDVAITSFENWREKGGNLDTGPLSFYAEPAPLVLEINAPDTPIVISDPEDPEKQQTFTVGLSMKNLGGGYVKEKTLSEIRLCFDRDFVFPIISAIGGGSYGNFEEVIDTDGDGRKDCLIIQDESNLSLIGLTNQWKDVSVQFETLQGSILVQDVANFNARVTYTYAVDQSTQITMVG